MSSDRFLLWGIDGQLEGSEHLLQMRLPLFTREGEDDAVYVARRANWSESLPESDVERVPMARAEEYGDRLAVGEISISPGEMVVVFGPKLYENLLRIDVAPDIHAWTPDGFAVAVKSATAAEEWAFSIERVARRRFDRELAEGLVTDDARAALEVMRNVAVGDLRAHLIRTLAVHSLDGDTDRYRRVLRLAQVRLRDETDVLEAEVWLHLQLMWKLPRVELPRPGRKGYRSGKIVRSRKALAAARITNVKPVTTEIEYVRGAINRYVSQQILGQDIIGKKFVNPKLFSSVQVKKDERTKALITREDL
jgi:hypothetical protein